MTVSADPPERVGTAQAGTARAGTARADTMAPRTTPPSPDELLNRLDPEQREVATRLGGPVAVIAGAGTGKTRAITHRIAYAVASGVYNPTSVLAVTFTTRAAGEMRGRLQQLGIPRVQARTFHSAALRQAQYFWPKAYGGQLPAVLENRVSLVAEAASRLRMQTDRPGLRDLVAEIAWAKVSNVGPEKYAELANRHDRQLASFDADTVGQVFAGYEQLKRERQRIDFEDILLCTAAMISEHDAIAGQIRDRYRHLVVDEYQDVNPLQQALLDLWRGESQDLCVVGDPAQTIHSFAGARADFLTGFARRHPECTVIRLVRDYRSTPEIVRVANQLSQQLGPQSQTSSSTSASRQDAAALAPVTLQAQQASGPDPSFVEEADEAAEAAAVADWLVARHQAGIDYRQMAVLFRVNAQSPGIEQALADRDVPYLVRGGERFYERPEVRQALLTLRNQTVDSARPPDATADPDTADSAAIGDIKAVLSGLGWSEQPPSGGGQLRERWESLSALVAVAEDFATAHPGSSVADVSAELDRRAAVQHVPAARGVTVSTLHSAKGLEWDAVAVIGVCEGSLPFVLATSMADIAEERRLLYVGMTRARYQLRLSWARTRNGSGQRSPSRFLNGIRPGGANSDSSNTARRPRRGQRGSRKSALAATCRSCGHPLRDAGERKLGRHEDCPSTYDDQVLSRLQSWRKQRAQAESIPAFCVFTDATLVAIAEALPRTARQLIKVPGIGAAKIDRYGADVLEVIEQPSASSTKGGTGRGGG